MTREAEAVFTRHCRSDRIHLRPWKPGDVEAWYRLSQDEGINTFIFQSYRMEGPPDAEAFVHRWMRFFYIHRMGIVPICENVTREFLGICAIKYLHFDDETVDRPELMYRIARAHWGKGIATEAAGMLLRYGFGVLELHEVVAAVDAPNLASLRVIEKLGFSYLRDTTYQGHPYKLHRLVREPLSGNI